MTQETEPEIDSQSAAAVDLDTMTARKETLEDYTLRFAPRTQLHAELVAVASDIVFNKYLLKPSPKKPEFRRGMLYAINPVGFGSMLPAAGLSIIAFFGGLGAELRPYSPLVAIIVALVMPPILAAATQGRYYRRRTDDGIEPPCTTNTAIPQSRN